MQTQTRTQVSTSVTTAIGVTLITASAFAFAAAGVLAAGGTGPKLGIQLLASVTSSTVVSGAQDVPMVGITLGATNKDITVSTLRFTVTADDDGTFSAVENDIVAQDRIMSCSLFDKTRGTHIAGPEVIDASGILTFSQINTTIQKGKRAAGEVRCNFSALPPQSDTSDIYALSLLNDADVEAETPNGTALTDAQIILEHPTDPGVNTNRSVAVSVIETGTLTAALDTSTPASGILLASSTNLLVATYRFTATNEPFSIDSLAITNSGDSVAASIVSITYKNRIGATVRTSSSLSGNQAVFRGIDAYVAPGTPLLLDVSVDTNIISTQGADSGDTLQFSLDADSSFSAEGVISAETITNVGSDIPANTFTLRKTKPTLSLAAGSPTGAAIPSMGEVLRFNVASDPSDDVEFHQVTFKVNSTAQNPGWNLCGGATDLGNATKWEMYDINDPATKLDDNSDWSFREADGSTCEPGDTLAYAVLNFRADTATSSETIGAGDTTTYVLRVNTTGAGIDDTIQIRIPEESIVPSVSSFVWGDGVSQTPIDGTGLKNLPVIGGQLHY